MKIELKHLAVYLPYSLKLAKCRFDEDYNRDWSLPPVKIDMTVHNILVCIESQNLFKPILRPIADLSLSFFNDMVKDAFGWKDTYFAEISGCYSVCEKTDSDKGDLQAEDYWGDAEFIQAAAEIDSENVVSISRPKKAVRFTFDVAYGIDEELRFFMSFETNNDLREQLFSNHFDVFGLIPAGLAIDINTLQS